MIHSKVKPLSKLCAIFALFCFILLHRVDSMTYLLRTIESIPWGIRTYHKNRTKPSAIMIDRRETKTLRLFCVLNCSVSFKIQSFIWPAPKVYISAPVFSFRSALHYVVLLDHCQGPLVCDWTAGMDAITGLQKECHNWTAGLDVIIGLQELMS